MNTAPNTSAADQTLLSTVDSSFFETIYLEAAGNADAVPWSDGVPNPALVSWLNAKAHEVLRCGSRVAIVGCGLGEDARELIRRGYDVTAFDVSPTAIAWAKENDPANAGCYHLADLFDLPTNWHHRFDLVVEIYTVQALPPSKRCDTLSAIATLLSSHGGLLIICRGTKESKINEDGPPWALTESELLDAVRAAGLQIDGQLDAFEDDETPPKLRLRGLFRRAV